MKKGRAMEKGGGAERKEEKEEPPTPPQMVSVLKTIGGSGVMLTGRKRPRFPKTYVRFAEAVNPFQKRNLGTTKPCKRETSLRLVK